MLHILAYVLFTTGMITILFATYELYQNNLFKAQIVTMLVYSNDTDKIWSAKDELLCRLDRNITSWCFGFGLSMIGILLTTLK